MGETDARILQSRNQELEQELQACHAQLAQLQSERESRQALEEALRDSEARFRAFAQATTEAIVLHEHDK